MSGSDDRSSTAASPTAPAEEKKYKGVRRRKWGKWVSEIRVPGTRDRIWLGSYTTQEAAAIAHEVAFYCLRGPSSALQNLNFSLIMPAGVRSDMSPRSVQKVASDAGMAVDAARVDARNQAEGSELSISKTWWGPEEEEEKPWEFDRKGEALSISVEDYF